MPVKPLPKRLVEDLRRHHRIIDGALGGMKNIDHRRGRNPGVSQRDTHEYGRRIRQMNVSRNYPGVELVIKRVHGGTAQRNIDYVREIIREHNRKYRPKRYRLRMPKAYAISEELVAMAKADCPSINEIIGSEKDKTDRGARFLEQLSKEHGVQIHDLVEAVSEVCRNIDSSTQNSLVLGYEGEKFIFIPLIDMG